jgi:biopolymer transport protein ExbB
MKRIVLTAVFFAFLLLPLEAQEVPGQPAEEPLSELSEQDETVSFPQQLKTKFVEGNPYFMGVISLVLVLGLACSIERIIYLNLADVNHQKLIRKTAAALDNGNVESAKDIARNTRGPVASIVYQGLMRIEQDVDVIEKSIVSCGSLQAGLLERNFSWIKLFIVMAPSLGFLGTVIGLIQAFDSIEQAANINPTIVAGGMKVALITTVAGLIVALILQLFYNYLLNKNESIVHKMEDAAISLLDLIIKYKTSHAGK